MSMSVWQSALEALDLNVHTVRYEDLTADFETQVRDLLGVLKLEWTDDIFSYHHHAAKKKINTPSENIQDFSLSLEKLPRSAEAHSELTIP